MAVGIDPAFLSTLFGYCQLVAKITNSYGLHNEEFGAPISVCSDPIKPMDELWPEFKAFH